MNNNNQTSNEEETTLNQTTIMPTMIDNEEISNVEKKVDLSAIIPEYQEEGLFETESLMSNDKEYKSDGSVLIGKINDDYSVEMLENVSFPEQIDMVKRKHEKQRQKNQKKKKKEKTKISDLKKEQKRLNISTLIGLGMLAIVVAFGIYYYYKPETNGFEVMSFDVELGSKLPVRKNAYVKDASGEITDEMSYKIDTSEVVIDEIGTYQYKVWHKGQTKYGKINIVDTTAPSLEVKNLIINEGDLYEAKEFVANCTDLTGCNYSFEEAGTEKKYTTPGTYSVYIVAKDAFENRTIKQASLTIEAKGMVKYFIKDDPYNFEQGYQLTTTYEIHFTDFLSNSIILNGVKTEVRTFQDENSYKTAYDKYYGVLNYVCDDNKMTITYTEKITQVGNNYSRMDDVTYYLTSNGYSEIDR